MPLIQRNPDGSLPNSFFTPTRAVFSGLAVGGFAIIALFGWGELSHAVTQDPTAPPPCFALENLGPYAPGASPGADHGDYADKEYQQWDGDALIAAEAHCTPTGCEAKAWKAYRKALGSYMFHRTLMAHNLDMAYADRGVDQANRFYDTPQDHERVSAMRALYRAGVFHLKDLGDYEDGVAMLVAGPEPQTLRACRDGKRHKAGETIT